MKPDALQILRAAPLFEVTTDPSEETCLRYDNTALPVRLEYRARVNAATVHLLADAYPDPRTTPLVVVARTITEQARTMLRERGIGSVDASGNITLELPGLLAHYTAKTTTQPAPGAAPPARLSGKSGTLAQALLLDPDRAWTVTDLAGTGETSTALAHRVLDRLEREQIMTSSGTGPAKTRTVTNPAALLDLWVEEQRDPVTRTGGYLLIAPRLSMIDAAAEKLEATKIEHAFTGAAQSARIAPLLTTVPTVEVYIPARFDAPEVLRSIGATTVDTGANLTLIQHHHDTALAFRRLDRGVWSVNPFRLYLDLLADPRRGPEQAENLRTELIGF